MNFPVIHIVPDLLPTHHASKEAQAETFKPVGFSFVHNHIYVKFSSSANDQIAGIFHTLLFELWIFWPGVYRPFVRVSTTLMKLTSPSGFLYSLAAVID